MTPEELEPLSPELARLLDAERPLQSAPPAAKARLFARLAAELFPGGGTPSGGEGGKGGGAGGAPPVGGVSAQAGWTAAAAAKLAVGVGVVSFTVGGLVGAGVQSVRAKSTPPAAVVPVAAPPAPPAVVPAPGPPPPAEPVKPPAPAARPRPPGDGSLQEENSLIETARAALARKDAAAALEALAAHQARFPRGQLAEERAALEVLALASAGRLEEARVKAQRFRADFPAGLFRGLVDGAAPP